MQRPYITCIAIQIRVSTTTATKQNTLTDSYSSTKRTQPIFAILVLDTFYNAVLVKLARASTLDSIYSSSCLNVIFKCLKANTAHVT